MRNRLVAFVACLLLPAISFAGGLFGTLKQGKDPAPAGTEIKVEIGGKTYTGKTDASGRYNIGVGPTGKATISVAGASLEVTVYKDPVQCNLILDGGTLKTQ